MFPQQLLRVDNNIYFCCNFFAYIQVNVTLGNYYEETTDIKSLNILRCISEKKAHFLQS